jgi:hypothetical protein
MVFSWSVFGLHPSVSPSFTALPAVKSYSSNRAITPCAPRQQTGISGVQSVSDTLVACIQPDQPISDAMARVYPLKLHILGMPLQARITDLDLYLDITHNTLNELRIALYSPQGRKVEVMPRHGCMGQPVAFPENIKVTFNDQVYDINIYNQTGQQQPAIFRCTNAKPSIGAYNYGQMRLPSEKLSVFNDLPLHAGIGTGWQFTIKDDAIDVAAKRFSGFKVHQFIPKAGLSPGDRLLMEYKGFAGQPIGGLAQGQLALFEVVNNQTLRMIEVAGTALQSVVPGSGHTFAASAAWLLVVEDLVPQSVGHIHQACLRIGYATEDDPGGGGLKGTDAGPFGRQEAGLPGEVGSVFTAAGFADSDHADGGEGFALHQNTPNPFRDQTLIGFTLPERTRATLKVFDATGRLIRVEAGEYAKGYHSIPLQRADLAGHSLLIYRLDTPTHSATKRMILLD